MKKNEKIKIQLHISKKDTFGLFTGKFKKQVFADKKDKLEKEHRKEKQKTYFL